METNRTYSPRLLVELALVAASLGCNVALWSRDGSCAVGTILGDERQDEAPDVIATPDGDVWRVAPATPDGEAFLALV
jgi:hypothetical protein